MAISAIDQQLTASSGCCIGQAWTVAAGFGPPNRVRHAVAIALIGFQLAKSRSTVGMPWVGTNAFEQNVRGRKNMNPTACAASALRITMPAQAPTQVAAKANKADS